MRPSDRVVRIAAVLVVVAGLAAAGVAILAEELGLGAEAGRGQFGLYRTALLTVGVTATAVGALLVARPRIAARVLDWWDTGHLPPIDWGRPSPLRRGWFELGLLAQVVAGALIIGVGIDAEAMYWDEIASVTVAERSLGDIFGVLANVDANMGFYYLLLHAWMWVGDSDAWIRALSALPAVAAIPLTAVLARRLFGDPVGLAAGFLMVGSMFVVFYAQMARAYPLALLLITVATLLFVEAIRSRRPVHFVAYGAASALAIYAAPLSILALVAHAASLAFLPQARVRARPFAPTYAAMLVAVVPLGMLMFLAGSQQVSHREGPGLSEAIVTAWGMFGAGNDPVAVAYATLAAIGLVALWLGWTSGGRQGEAWRWRRALVVGWLLLPPVLLFVVSQVEPLMRDRYLLTSAPALAILAAVGLVAVARRSRALAAVAAAAVICLAVLARIDLGPRAGGWPDDDRAAARMIATESRPGDGIAYGPVHRVSMAWNLEREAEPGASLPVDFAVATEATEVDGLFPLEVSPGRFASRLRDHPRIWLVLWDSSGPDQEMMEAGLPVLQSEYRRVRSDEFGVIEVELYERKRER